jgi:hypothetical protein
MNLLNLCLRIPNLGILLFYLFFVVLIPYILIANSSMQILKYYMPMMVAFAHMLSLSGHDKLFGNLYDLRPKNFVSFLSTNFINLFALFGILWQCITYAESDSASLPRAVVYGIILFVIAFPMARQGMKFVLDNVDLYLREKTAMTFEYNWHLFVFGLIYIIFLLGIQAVMLALVDTSRKQSESDRMRAELDKYKENKRALKSERNKLMAQMNNDRKSRNKAEKNALELRLKEAEKDEEKVNELINNIKENINQVENNNKNKNKANDTNANSDMTKTRELLNSISMSNLSSFAKKQGINV